VVLNETSHKDWATKDNSILIESSGTIPCEDGVFFTNQNDFNNGVFYSWSEEEAISAMEKAESKVGQVNTDGVEMGDTMTYGETTKAILSLVSSKN